MKLKKYLIAVVFQLLPLLLGLHSVSRAAEVKIPSEIKVKVKRLTKIVAESETPVKWINLHDDLDLIPDSAGKHAIILGAKVGRYKIAAYTADDKGPSEPAYCVVIVEGDEQPSPVPPTPIKPKPSAPEQALVRIRFGNAGCTATITLPRRPDGKWNVLSAAHCIGNAGMKGSMTLKNGKTYALSVVKIDRTSDVSWLVTDEVIEDLPAATLATTIPPIGTRIWHMGYGVDKPGNKEEGTILSGLDSHGQIRMRLSVSSGDSGGGIFREDTGEIVACVCCTAGMARVADVWGGSSISALKLLGNSGEEIIHPIIIHPVESPTVETGEEPSEEKVHPVKRFRWVDWYNLPPKASAGR